MLPIRNNSPLQPPETIEGARPPLVMDSSSSKGISFVIYKGSPDRRVVQGTTYRSQLNGDEVLIRITHSSLCGTDEHYLNEDMCLGHEGAGVVQSLGPDVKTLKVYVFFVSPSTGALTVAISALTISTLQWG